MLVNANLREFLDSRIDVLSANIAEAFVNVLGLLSHDCVNLMLAQLQIFVHIRFPLEKLPHNALIIVVVPQVDLGFQVGILNLEFLQLDLNLLYINCGSFKFLNFKLGCCQLLSTLIVLLATGRCDEFLDV